MKIYILRHSLPHQEGKMVGVFTSLKDAERVIKIMEYSFPPLNKTEMGEFTYIEERELTGRDADDFKAQQIIFNF